MTTSEIAAAAQAAAAATRTARSRLDTLDDDELPQRPLFNPSETALLLRQSRTIRVRAALDSGRLTNARLALLAQIVDGVG